ncbi:MAG: 50S ribosomal protein L24 [Acidobacteria bacterium]|nr:50S ribosomal protein L24 [Acidobacteriota bacterium]
MALKIKKGDTVVITVGKDRDRRGKVLAVMPAKNRVLVEGLNMIKKHQRAMGNREGGIIEKEAPLHISNVMLVDPKEDKASRVGYVLKDGKKHRVAKRSNQLLD